MAIANYSDMPYLADGKGTFANVSQWVINGFSDITQNTTPGYSNGIDYLVDGNGDTIKGF